MTILGFQACGSATVSVSNHSVPQPEARDQGRVQVLHPYLASRLQKLEQRSGRLRAALDTLRAGSVDVLIGTPELLASAAPLLGAQMAPPRVGEFAALVAPASGELQALIVRIDLERLARLPPSRSFNLLSWFSERRRRAALDRLVDAVLIHEVWGHLIPVASAGALSGRCADPQAGERETNSCVMQRENDLRREMKLPERRHYAVDVH